MLIPDEMIIELVQWFKSEPKVDLKRRNTDKIDFVMYHGGWDGQYGHCTEIEVSKWRNNEPDDDYLYEYEVCVTARTITIDIACPFNRIEFDASDYVNLSEEEFFQYSLVHDVPCISPESLVLLAELSTLLQEEI